ncbi:DUF397 domain-containing protein [Pseudonocardia endophytica]|uniref:Uncharacterized protein DUF397 n=1 Tax=Pseudonocardia endophytica TaxID=401976 RepID=A0A4R1HEK6_PSEEN|nr:DUF397 domain-containing protein [Pseudonocardia endophytica]TCK20038.1 uncharacterized protein DUF397 [Pseudonocardia endophytica]
MEDGTTRVWRKSSASNPQGNCVELAMLEHGRVGMRNSRDPHGAVLDYPAVALDAFLGMVRDGALDER